MPASWRFASHHASLLCSRDCSFQPSTRSDQEPLPFPCPRPSQHRVHLPESLRSSLASRLLRPSGHCIFMVSSTSCRPFEPLELLQISHGQAGNELFTSPKALPNSLRAGSSAHSITTGKSLMRDADADGLYRKCAGLILTIPRMIIGTMPLLTRRVLRSS